VRLNFVEQEKWNVGITEETIDFLNKHDIKTALFLNYVFHRTSILTLIINWKLVASQ
jgi:hypothetical protein